MWLSNNFEGGATNGSREGGFTMVEIALSLAVVAFALVAIMGVLPTGMTVEKDNREDTLMNQEGRYWLDAIRNGAIGLEDITNYVEYIKVERRKGTTNIIEVKNTGFELLPIDVIAMLSAPKYDLNNFTNHVTARMKPITGAAAEKGTITNDVSLRYQLHVEITPYSPMPPAFVGQMAAQANDPRIIQFNQTMAQNLWDVRLVLRWPVVERGNGYFIGNGRKTFRARIAGNYQVETNVTTAIRNLFPKDLVVLRPNQFNVTAP